MEIGLKQLALPSISKMVSMIRWSLCFLMLPFVLSACVSLPKAPLNVQIKASNHLNPDASQRSLPVRLKLYQLKDATLFKEATFRQLWKADTNVLGDTLLEKKELTINPGETQSITMPRRQDARYLGVAGMFRKPTGHHWKEIKVLPGEFGAFFGRMTLTVKNNTVDVQS